MERELRGRGSRGCNFIVSYFGCVVCTPCGGSGIVTHWTKDIGCISTSPTLYSGVSTKLLGTGSYAFDDGRASNCE